MRHISKETKDKMRSDLYGNKLAIIQYRETSKEFKKKLREKKAIIKKEEIKAAKKIKRLVRKKAMKERLNIYASELNKNLPSSEKWFWKKYSQFADPNDKQNLPWGPFIYDVLNHQSKYAIEIDGSIHDTKKQKERDNDKDNYVRKFGYEIIRIKAYDENSFNDALMKIGDIRRVRNTNCKILVNIKK